MGERPKLVLDFQSCNQKKKVVAGPGVIYNNKKIMTMTCLSSIKYIYFVNKCINHPSATKLNRRNSNGRPIAQLYPATLRK
jgi:hypothetical protein